MLLQYRLEGVGKEFGPGQVALANLNLSVAQGERVALIGPSGAGKTTLFRMLNCTLPPTSGRIWIGADEAVGLHGRRLREIRRRIGTVYQQHNLVPRLKVIHNVLSGKLGRWSLMNSLVSLLRPADLDLAYDALTRVGIEEKLFSRTDELSGGQQQRVAIARVLVQDPDVVLADEPVSSVDPSLATTIVKLLIDITDGTKKTLLVNLHSTELALTYFPRIVGIKNGRPLFDAPPERITSEILQELYADHSGRETSESLTQAQPSLRVGG